MKQLLSILLIGLSPWLMAEPATYFFCVSSSNFETFQAKVTFQSIDFGQNAAKSMVHNEVKDKLGKNVSITPFSKTRCACADSCAVLEVRAKDWDGNFNSGDMSTETVLGTAAEVADKVVTEAKRVFTDPGGYFKSYFSNRKVQVLKSNYAGEALKPNPTALL